MNNDGTYTLEQNWCGSTNGTATAHDGEHATAVSAVFTIDCVNDPPVANPQDVQTSEDVALPVLVTGSDLDGDALTFTITSSPGSGFLSTLTQISQTTAEVTYTPNPDFNGADSFTFKVDDGKGGAADATISVTVNPAADCPVANPQTLSVDEDNVLPVLLTGSDVDGDSLTFTIASGPNKGSLGPITPQSPTSVALTYSPAPNFNGPDSFTFWVNDGTVDSAPAIVSITVNAVNDAPWAKSDTATTDEDTQKIINPLANDSDPEGNSIALDSVDDTGTTGTISIMGNSVVYNPNGQFEGLNVGQTATDTFSYTVCDDQTPPACNSTSVTVTITGVNDGPVPVDDAFSTFGNTLLEVGVSPSGSPAVKVTGSVLTQGIADADVDGPNPLTVIGTQNVTSGAQVNMNADGTFSYTPPPGMRDTDDSFDYILSDGADTAVGTVTINISEMVWYIDNAEASAGLGTSSEPFNSIALFNSSASQIGDTVFVHSGNGTNADYTNGITLKNNQALLGEGVDLVISGVTLVNGSVSERPVLTAGWASHGIALALGNTVRGLDVGDTGGVGIFGAIVGVLTINNVAIGDSGSTGGSGAAMDIQGGSLTVNIDSIISDSGITDGIHVTTSSGTVTVSGTTTISSTTGDGIDFSFNTATFNFNGSPRACGCTVTGHGKAPLAARITQHDSVCCIACRYRRKRHSTCADAGVFKPQGGAVGGADGIGSPGDSDGSRVRCQEAG
ncbi:MAG: tandem-95 repeat protein, partial [Deltaproteobacteria bacterium]|nr:tandem-95 repeat protein [Deltaproteobacteria bacterium]